jgi:Lrp/AsnC family transcriptional regulator for asnA, asnC and gidA
MDELDEQIVRLLEHDAHQTSDVIAKKINVSSATVRRRLKRLLDSGELLIEAYRDPFKTGFPILTMIGLNIERKLYDEVILSISKLPEITWVYTTTGRYDAMAFVVAPSTDSLYLFLKDVLNKITGIKEIESFLCLHIEKRKTLL